MAPGWAAARPCRVGVRRDGWGGGHRTGVAQHSALAHAAVPAQARSTSRNSRRPHPQQSRRSLRNRRQRAAAFSSGAEVVHSQRMRYWSSKGLQEALRHEMHLRRMRTSLPAVMRSLYELRAAERSLTLAFLRQCLALQCWGGSRTGRGLRGFAACAAEGRATWHSRIRAIHWGPGDPTTAYCAVKVCLLHSVCRRGSVAVVVGEPALSRSSTLFRLPRAAGIESSLCILVGTR